MHHRRKKKTPIIDFPLEEVPFPTKNGSVNVISASSEKESKDIIEEKSVFEETQIVEPESMAQQFEEIQSQPIKSNNFTISAEFLNSVTMMSTAISSEELEHVDDNWLDAAYETKLLKEGDNLMALKTIKSIVAQFSPSSEQKNNSQNDTQSSNNGSATAAVPTRTTVPIFVPDYELEDPNAKIVELPENPTEADLLHFAENHPIVHRAVKIFRGKIVKVTKDN